MTQTDKLNDPVQNKSGLRETQTAPVSSWFKPRSAIIEAGDLFLLVTTDHKRYLITLQPHQRLHTHVGIYEHDHMLGQPPGATVHSTLNHPALVLEPGLTDLIQH